MQTTTMFGVDFAPVTLNQAVDYVFSCVQTGQRARVATANVAIAMMASDEPDLRRYLNDAELVVADGQPLVWLSRATAHPLPERVTGVDLIDAVCERAAGEGVGVYLLGGKPETLTAACRALRDRFSGLTIDGSHGYFDMADSFQRAQLVAASDAAVLFVGMGVPRQEKFLNTEWPNLGVRVCMGVGGSFDVLSGERRRAPKYLQKLGLEWAFRMVQEPRRLARRYLVTNSLFTLRGLSFITSRILTRVFGHSSASNHH